MLQTNSTDRRRAPRLSVLATCTVKCADGRMVQAHLSDISPSGARIATREQIAPGTAVKLYLRNGKVLEASVVRATETGIALDFADAAPGELPAKTFFWKLDSYAFASGAYAPEHRHHRGRHLPADSMIENCTVTAWGEDAARFSTPLRLAIGARIHLGGRAMTVVRKLGATYEARPAEAVAQAA